ncbi:hypothetical protein V2W45_1360885 [Cenococcum geophilum]
MSGSCRILVRDLRKVTERSLTRSFVSTLEVFFNQKPHLYFIQSIQAAPPLCTRIVAQRRFVNCIDLNCFVINSNQFGLNGKTYCHACVKQQDTNCYLPISGCAIGSFMVIT